MERSWAKKYWLPLTILLLVISLNIGLCIFARTPQPKPILHHEQHQHFLLSQHHPQPFAAIVQATSIDHSTLTIALNNHHYPFYIEHADVYPLAKDTYKIKFSGKLKSQHTYTLSGHFIITTGRQRLVIRPFFVRLIAWDQQRFSPLPRLYGRITTSWTKHTPVAAHIFLNLNQLYAYLQLKSESYPQQLYWQAEFNIKPFDLNKLASYLHEQPTWLNRSQPQRLSLSGSAANKQLHLHAQLNRSHIKVLASANNAWPYGLQVNIKIDELNVTRLFNAHSMPQIISQLMPWLTQANYQAKVAVNTVRLGKNRLQHLTAIANSYMHQFNSFNINFFLNRQPVTANLHIDENTLNPLIALFAQASHVAIGAFRPGLQPLQKGLATITLLCYSHGRSSQSLAKNFSASLKINAQQGQLNFDLRPSLIRGLQQQHILGLQPFSLPSKKPTRFDHLSLILHYHPLTTTIQAHLDNLFFTANATGTLTQQRIRLSAHLTASTELTPATTKAIAIHIRGQRFQPWHVYND